METIFEDGTTSPRRREVLPKKPRAEELKSLKVISWNIQSTSEKNMIPLRHILKSKPHVVALQETGTISNECRNIFTEKGYSLINSMTRIGGVGGGTAIWVTDELIALPVDTPPLDGAEVTAIRILANTKGNTAQGIALASWYISPNAKVPPTSLETYVKALQDLGISMVVGDPNARHKQWCPRIHKHPCGISDCGKRGDSIRKLTSSSAWKVANNGTPTFSAGTAPDVILYCLPTRCSFDPIRIATSDHFPILSEVTVPGIMPKRTRRRCIQILWESVDWGKVDQILTGNTRGISTDAPLSLFYRKVLPSETIRFHEGVIHRTTTIEYP
jgi:hypothetical protein